MLSAQRQEEILKLIDENGAMRTVELAERFSVTDETIRRDLLELSKKGRVKRIHGGACSQSGRPKLRSFNERSALNIGRKRSIAKAARALFRPGRMYAFDSSTTAVALVEHMPDIPCRVVSNALVVFEHLVAMKNVELIAIGGRFHPSTQTFVSAKSAETLKQYHIDMAFVSCVGFNLSHGASEGFEEQALYKEALVEMAEQTVLLVDSTKFKIQSEYYFAPVDTIDHIVTDSFIEPGLVREIRKRGTPLTIAEAG